MHRQPGTGPGHTRDGPGTRLTSQPGAGRRPVCAGRLRRHVAEMQAAGVTANWQDPGLAKYASGTALNTLVTGLHNDHKPASSSRALSSSIRG